MLYFAKSRINNSSMACATSVRDDTKFSAVYLAITVLTSSITFGEITVSRYDRPTVLYKFCAFFLSIQ